MTSPAARDNATVYRPGQRGTYEVYYLKCNDPASGVALWLRYTILAPARADAPEAAEVWAIAFDPAGSRHAAAKETFPIGSLGVEKDPFALRIDGSVLRHDGAEGQVASPSGRIRWRLSWTGAVEGLRPFPHASMYRGPFPRTKVLSPNVDVRMSGEVEIDGRLVALAGAPGMQAHLYGTRHAASWTWCHVNAWDDGAPAWLEAVTARVELGPLPLPPLTVLAVEHAGERHVFNAPSQLLRGNAAAPREPSFTLAGESGSRRIEAMLTASPDQFVGVRYVDPDGSERICRNTKIARCRLRLLRRAGPGAAWELEEELTSSRGAALEFVDGAGHPRVPVLI